MKQTFIFLSLLLLAFLPACNLEKIDENENPNTFKKNFGCMTCPDKAFSITKTSDGNFVLAGETAGFGSNKNDAFLWKIDAFGNPVWDQPKLFFYGTNDDAAYAVIEASNQNLILTGVCDRPASGQGRIFLVETFPDGSEKNTRAFDNGAVGAGVGSYLADAHDVVESNDGGLVLAGSIDLCNPGCYHMWLGKTDRMGLDQNSDGWGSGINTYGIALTKNTSGYFCAGHQLIGSPANYDIFLAVRKTDDFTLSNNFNMATNATPGNQYLNDMLTTNTGSLLAVGSDDASASGASDILFMEFSSANLSIINNKKISEPDAEKANAVIQTSDGNYVITGEVTINGNTDLLLIKVSKSGDKIWKYNYGGSFKDAGYALVELADGSLLVTGYTQSTASPESSDIYLVRTDRDGKVQ